MFEPVLALPRDPGEARLIAESLDALARALRDWPAEAWQKITPEFGSGSPSGLFERLVIKTAPAALDPRQRERATRSASAVADVLRVLWPETRGMSWSSPARVLAVT